MQPLLPFKKFRAERFTIPTQYIPYIIISLFIRICSIIYELNVLFMLRPTFFMCYHSEIMYIYLYFLPKYFCIYVTRGQILTDCIAFEKINRIKCPRKSAADALLTAPTYEEYMQILILWNRLDFSHIIYYNGVKATAKEGLSFSISRKTKNTLQYHGMHLSR